MYRVYLNDKMINSGAGDNKIYGAEITYSDNAISKFEFSVPATHPMIDSFAIRTAPVTVYSDSDLIFKGRIIDMTTDFYGDLEITCEGQEAYLRDSIMLPFAWTGTIEGLLKMVIDNHNSQVDADRQITIGTVEATKLDSNDNIVRSNENAETTWSCLQNKFIDELGGYFRLTSDRVLNYYADYPGINEQEIRFGKNLLTLEQCLDGSEVITAIKAYGAKIDGFTAPADDANSMYAGGRITVDIIHNSTGEAIFGTVVGTETWDDVTDTTNLTTKATAYLAECISAALSIDATALDLGLVGDYVSIQQGKYIRVLSAPHGIDTTLPVTKLVLNLNNPDKTKVTAGIDRKSLTDRIARGD